MVQFRKTPLGESLLTVDPSENVMIGSKVILEYMGLKRMSQLVMYVEIYGFPAIKRPDGMWMTTMTAIDQWIWLAAEVDHENRGPRGDTSVDRVTSGLLRKNPKMDVAEARKLAKGAVEELKEKERQRQVSPGSTGLPPLRKGWIRPDGSQNRPRNVDGYDRAKGDVSNV